MFIDFLFDTYFLTISEFEDHMINMALGHAFMLFMLLVSVYNPFKAVSLTFVFPDTFKIMWKSLTRSSMASLSTLILYYI